MQQQQAFFFEVYRSGLRAAADMMKTSLEGAERIQNQQLEGLRGLMEENVRSTRQFSEASTIGELMSLQTRLASAQMERTLDYWTRTWRTASETQAAFIGQAQKELRQLGEGVREGYAANTSHAANISTGHERKERKSA